MINKVVKKFSDEIAYEQRMIFETAPKDDIDWALIMYLYRHSTEIYGYSALYKEGRNVITVGKLSKYFDLDYNKVYERLERMKWWVNIGTVYGFYKPFNICDITVMGIEAINKTLEMFEERGKIYTRRGDLCQKRQRTE